MTKPPNLADIAYEALKAGRKPAEPRDYIYASELRHFVGDGCPRQCWLNLQAARRREPSPGQLWRFRHGSRIQDELLALIQPGLENKGWFLSGEEISVRSALVHGRLDFLFDFFRDNLHRPGYGRLVVEVKSLRGAAFRHNPTEHKTGDLVQAAWYAKELDAQWICVPYVDREGDNGIWLADPMPMTDELRELVASAEEKARAMVLLHKSLSPTNMTVDPEANVGRGPSPPRRLEPVVTTKPLKNGATSVHVRPPWQCAWCDYRFRSCETALPNREAWGAKDKGLVVGRITQGKYGRTQFVTDDELHATVEALAKEAQ